VCHRPAALTHIKLTSSGKHLLEAQAITGLLNTEEIDLGTMDIMPFNLGDELNKASGGKYEKTANWGENVVVARGGDLITGQNPASAGRIGQAIYDSIAGGSTTK
jgi:putative intracellular protease/amidase